MVRIYWQYYNRKHDHHLPPHLVQGGRRHNGEPFYICRALVHKELCIGKFYPRRKIGKVPYGGEEYRVEVCDLLVCDKPHMLKWVPMADGNTPFGAVAGGCTKDANTLFVGRAREDGEVLPGKIHPKHQRIYVGDDGKEVSHHHYEALAMKHVIPPRRMHRHAHHGRHAHHAHHSSRSSSSSDAHDYDH